MPRLEGGESQLLIFFKISTNSLLGPMQKIKLDSLIEIVANGGSVKTGIDIFNQNDILLLDKNVRVKDVRILENIKKSGMLEIPVKQKKDNGILDRTGRRIEFQETKTASENKEPKFELSAKINEIKKERQEAARHYKIAQTAIRKVFMQIRETRGTFDTSLVSSTVKDLLYYAEKNWNSLAHLMSEILSYDKYLYNHSVNVCILATAVLKKFNSQFEEINQDFLSRDFEETAFSRQDPPAGLPVNTASHNDYEIATGFFLHDVGKVLINEALLHKQGPLTPEEFSEIKKHSYEKGLEILQKNNIQNIFAQDIVAFHHGPLYPGEKNCYPDHSVCRDLPPYVKICKLADIYDARTSKRCYKEAQNPAEVMSDIFNHYVNRDKNLQLILHSFINIIGLCPPGSIVLLNNGQMAYVLSSRGPLVIPFTNTKGETLKQGMAVIDLDENNTTSGLEINREIPIAFPIEVYHKLPPDLRTAVQ